IRFRDRRNAVRATVGRPCTGRAAAVPARVGQPSTGPLTEGCASVEPGVEPPPREDGPSRGHDRGVDRTLRLVARAPGAVVDRLTAESAHATGCDLAVDS